MLGQNARKVYEGYLAGTDQERLDDIHAMFADKRVDAIFCARGGYGTTRLLASLDYDLIKRNAKIFVGFSDTTALQFAILKRTGLVTFSGAMPSVDMADGFDSLAEESLWRALTSTKPLGVVQKDAPLSVVKKGKCEGAFVAGNLSLISNLIGTPYMPSLRNAILAVEDIGEETYRIDRLLTHLVNAGVMSSISGLVTGYWTQKKWEKGMTANRDVRRVIEEIAEHVNGPVVSGLLYGHESHKLTLPIGVQAQVTTTGALKFTESALVV